MNEKARKALEVVAFIFIVVISVLIFIFRDRLTNVGEVGYLGVFILCFVANVTVLLPSPSLMIAASCATIMNPVLVALSAAAGSSLGELTGYAFGSVSQDLSPRFAKLLDKLTKKIHNDVLLVFILALLPLPLFDLVGIYSGGTRMNLLKFLIACFVGKFVKLLIYKQIYDLIELASGLVPSLK